MQSNIELYENMMKLRKFSATMPDILSQLVTRFISTFAWLADENIEAVMLADNWFPNQVIIEFSFL